MYDDELSWTSKNHIERFDIKGENRPTLFEAIESSFAKAAYVKGWDFNGNNDFDAAVEAAKNSDVIIFTTGGTSRRDFEAKYLNNGAVLETKPLWTAVRAVMFPIYRYPHSKLLCSNNWKSLESP